METHHPNHVTHKKKWGEYLIEFFMLFLAVFLGFVAENYREHLTAKESEKRNIETLIASLAGDTLQLHRVILANIKVVHHLDSLLHLRNADLSIEANKRAFLTHAVVGFSEDWYFTSNDAAFQQLKSSGSLRLIRHQNVLDSIFKYDANNKALTAQQEDCYWIFKESVLEFKNTINLFFYRDTSVMKYSLGYDNSGIEFKNIHAVTLPADKEKIDKLFGVAALMTAPDEA